MPPPPNDPNQAGIITGVVSGIVGVFGFTGTLINGWWQRKTALGSKGSTDEKEYRDDLRDDLKIYKAELHELTGRVVMLEREAIGDKKTIAQLELKIERLEAELARMNDENTNHESTIDLLKAQLAQAYIERDVALNNMTRTGVIGGGEPSI